MRIAQIAPLAERVPPKLYGGTERIVHCLTEELVRLGHDVTLFASGDSLTSAELVPCSEVALRLNPDVTDFLPHHVVMLEEVRRRAQEFDVLHFHIDLLHFPLVRDFADRTVTTLHTRLDLSDLQPFYRLFTDIPLVSISDDQRRPIPPVNWRGTVYHGLDAAVLPFTERPAGNYLAFLGRISPEKGPERAIEIATRAGMPLKIAAKVDKADRAYWERVVEPMVASHANVEFIGEIDEHQKPEFLGNAAALLFPINWPEPFGLVMIEAMACGTPVLGFRYGSAPEVIEDGLSGVLVDWVEDAVVRMNEVLSLDRRRVRAAFERRFTTERMTRDYLDIYRNLPGVRSDTGIVRAAAGDRIGLEVAHQPWRSAVESALPLADAGKSRGAIQVILDGPQPLGTEEPRGGRPGQ
ncbi:glycosyltransferase family 4 protein [Sinorhizobium americanum]|uniref:Sugar transferase n=1 Tax=Sinorhizobium americanum TaxID=194963 RepID=A0A1L3LUT5_9HYPH|nr:glycosyltransferase family 4 protein [Sinorhizobium americanum]APG93832.1 sugar transferase [Sinorhizobium americanum]OAP46291.1 glycosyl transferase [Sinorhizobium americanum]